MPRLPLFAEMADSGLLFTKPGNVFYFSAFRIKGVIYTFLKANKTEITVPINAGNANEKYTFLSFGERINMNLYDQYIQIIHRGKVTWFKVDKSVPLQIREDRMKNNIKGIVFDMDNTLLRSNINFEAMKNETYSFLTRHGILPNSLLLENYTTATIIKEAEKTGLLSEDLFHGLWAIPKKFEVIGMKDVELEPGVFQLLEVLHGKYRMVIVTNNSVEAAKTALQDNKIDSFFDKVVGREMMKSLKPSPDGYDYILNQYKTIPAKEWLSIGDSWLDGKASQAAGIIFISYQGDIQKMNKMGVYPIANINNIGELLGFC